MSVPNTTWDVNAKKQPLVFTSASVFSVKTTAHPGIIYQAQRSSFCQNCKDSKSLGFGSWGEREREAELCGRRSGQTKAGTSEPSTRAGAVPAPAMLSSGKTDSKGQMKRHTPRFLKWDHFILPPSRPIPGAELEAEFSVASCAPSMFSLFSTCFFSVRVLEGSIGSRGRYGTTEDEEAALPSSSATSEKTTRGPMGNNFMTQKRFSFQKRYTTEKKLEKRALKYIMESQSMDSFMSGFFGSTLTGDSPTPLHGAGAFSPRVLFKRVNLPKLIHSTFDGY